MVRPQDTAVRLLPRVVDRQRRSRGTPRTRQQRRQPPGDRPATERSRDALVSDSPRYPLAGEPRAIPANDGRGRPARFLEKFRPTTQPIRAARPRRSPLCDLRPLRRSRATLPDACAASPEAPGWKSTAAKSVVTSDSAISLPMLDVPGWWENDRLPKGGARRAGAEQNGPRQLDCKNWSLPPSTP